MSVSLHTNHHDEFLPGVCPCVDVSTGPPSTGEGRTVCQLLTPQLRVASGQAGLPGGEPSVSIDLSEGYLYIMSWATLFSLLFKQSLKTMAQVKISRSE